MLTIRSYNQHGIEYIDECESVESTPDRVDVFRGHDKRVLSWDYDSDSYWFLYVMNSNGATIAKYQARK